MQSLSEKIKQKVIGVIADGPISQEFAQGYNRGLADAATLAEQWEREQQSHYSEILDRVNSVQETFNKSVKTAEAIDAFQTARITALQAELAKYNATLKSR